MLGSFLGMIKFYNNGVPMSIQFKEEIEFHLTYIWNHDKNAAIRTESDLVFFAELPDEYQN